MIKKIVFLLLTCGALTAMSQQRIQYPPGTDKEMDKSLKQFIDTFKAVVAREDAKKIYTLLDAQIINSVDEADYGPKNFKKNWHPEKKKELWIELKKLLAFGGQYSYNTQRTGKNKDEYVYPYFFEENIKGIEDYSGIFVVNGHHINMYKTADLKSEIVIKLSYEAVKFVADSTIKSKTGWQYVTTFDNQYQGYIKDNQLRNFIDYRMFFRKKKGIWKMTILVAER